jgi:tetratricopeptide (TPR) repeat protein
VSVPPVSVQASPPSGPSPQEIQARREALAKRLLGGQARNPTPPKPTPAVDPAHHPLRFASSSDAVDALRKRYEDRVDNATAAQARRYTKAGEDAVSKSDFVAAATSFHIATKFAPDDASLAARYLEVKAEADKLLCDSYIKQANYEERNQHWSEAARSWQKVCKVKIGDAKANAHAARCVLKSDDGDLHQAAEHAKAAVGAEPESVENHVVLAEIYLAAGLAVSAKRAAETGLSIDPKHTVLLGILKKT